MLALICELCDKKVSEAKETAMQVSVRKNSRDHKKVGFTTMCGGVVLFIPDDDFDLYIRDGELSLVESASYDEDQGLYAGEGDSITITL